MTNGQLGEMNVHDFQQNLQLSQCIEIKLLRARIRKFYELCFLGLIDIEQPSYENYQGKIREQKGIDTQVSFLDKNIKIQEKIRSEKYWNKRNIDIYVEMENQYRGGDGWFQKYKGNIDYLGYYWVNNTIDEVYFVLYNSDFFSLAENLIFSNKVQWFNPHQQINKEKKIGGLTKGCGINQVDLTNCEVARFHFSNNKFKRIKITC